ncbi:MAG: polymer-forming cytoskeletal protein [Candidatus Aureabacteria bacterium]|nr:polymer-forming cytoskeletal protein [Candidatus Auribacterota bacterium]
MILNEKTGTNLSEDADFKGAINFTNLLKVEGKFEGEVNSTGSLYISKSGKVKAEIKVKELESAGLINGNIQAAGTVKLDSSAKMFGNIKAEKLKIDEGVVFVGKCEVKPGGQEPNK